MSTLRVTTLQNASGVEVYTAKAWVNFNGTGTVAINGSGNVSSITDNGTGDYTINFTNAMSNTNYSVVLGSVSYTSSNYSTSLFIRAGGTVTTPSLKSTTQVQIAYAGGSTLYDAVDINVAIFR